MKQLKKNFNVNPMLNFETFGAQVLGGNSNINPTLISEAFGTRGEIPEGISTSISEVIQIKATLQGI